MKTHDKVIKKPMIRRSVRDEVERIQSDEVSLLAEKNHAAFYAEAVDRLEQMKKTSSGISADEVFDYFRQRVQGKSVTRSAVCKIK